MADHDDAAIQTLLGLFERLSELDRQELLRAAGVKDTRPPVLRRRGGQDELGIDWVKANAADIAPLILRWIDADDDDVAALVNGEVLRGGRSIFHRAISDTALVTFSVQFSSPSDASGGRIPLNELAANAVALNQLMMTLIAANRPFGAPMVMPDTAVTPGSTTFNLAGPGLLGFGLSVVGACAAGIVSAPVVWPLYLVGGALAAAGSIEAALGWRRTVAEITKMDREGRKIDDERGLLNLEKVKLRLEIEKLREEGRESREVRSQPASSMVPLEQVKEAANQSDVQLGYAHHVLNRLLPVLFIIRRQMPGISITVGTVQNSPKPSPPLRGPARGLGRR